MSEEYDKENFVHRKLVEIQKTQSEHRALTENIQAELRFLRGRLFQIDDEDEYWRRSTADLREEIQALKTRLEMLEDKHIQ